MTPPRLYHDPTSEPSRAVHWFAVEAGIELEVEYVWLTRGEHRSPNFLAKHPGHQVPALHHGTLCLTEASAIMVYLAEINGVVDLWIGRTPEERAQTNRFLSWHHTNTRLKLTLKYLLPVLLMPAYKGVAPPKDPEVEQLRVQGRKSLALLAELLRSSGDYLGGPNPSVADFFIASDLFALDIDPDRNGWFDGLPSISKWLERLRNRDGYLVSHAAWNAIVPRLRELISTPASTPRDPSWVADTCVRHLP
jgi:glutathione S-transferase